MKQALRIPLSCLMVCLLLLSAVSCRNRDFNPRSLPVDKESGKEAVSGFQCWVRTEDGDDYALSREVSTALFESAVKTFEKSDTIEAFPDTEGKLMLIFCVGGTAPESDIPAYQLPNSRHYGVYTLFPDDTGRYSSVLLTANVKSFRLKKGAYEKLLSLAQTERE